MNSAMPSCFETLGVLWAGQALARVQGPALSWDLSDDILAQALCLSAYRRVPTLGGHPTHLTTPHPMPVPSGCPHTYRLPSLSATWPSLHAHHQTSYVPLTLP